jgi:hypothetical protein
MLAFDFRPISVNERQNGRAGPPHRSGVPFPPHSGKERQLRGGHAKVPIPGAAPSVCAKVIACPRSRARNAAKSFKWFGE